MFSSLLTDIDVATTAAPAAYSATTTQLPQREGILKRDQCVRKFTGMATQVVCGRRFVSRKEKR